MEESTEVYYQKLALIGKAADAIIQAAAANGLSWQEMITHPILAGAINRKVKEATELADTLLNPVNQTT